MFSVLMNTCSKCEWELYDDDDDASARGADGGGGAGGYCAPPDDDAVAGSAAEWCADGATCPAGLCGQARRSLGSFRRPCSSSRPPSARCHSCIVDAASVTLPDAPPGQAESTAAQWLETLLLAIATSLVVSQPGNIFVKVLVVIGGSTLATVARRGRVSVSFITLRRLDSKSR